MKNIYNFSLKDLEDYFLNIGENKYKAKQIYNAIYRNKIKSFSNISTLSKKIREQIETEFYFGDITVRRHQKDQLVEKFLFALEDNFFVEAVLMYHDYGLSLCLSSQVGCNMACSFCKSGKLKKKRNLSAGEMVEQILKAEEIVGNKITRVVIMGIGEPFDNYDNFCKFIEIINDNNGLAIGSRHITVSTCGVIPKIKEFADFPYQVNLAISLHSAINEKRSKIMPINRIYNLEKLKEALKYYYNKTHRRLTLEYIMLDNFNDRKEDALALIEYIKDLNAYVNLIPYNKTTDEFNRSNDKNITGFYDILIKNKITATVRKEFGSKIDAACGQLSSKEEE